MRMFRRRRSFGVVVAAVFFASCSEHAPTPSEPTLQLTRVPDGGALTVREGRVEAMLRRAETPTAGAAALSTSAANVGS